MRLVVVMVLVTLLAWLCIVPAYAKQPGNFIVNELMLAEGLAILGGLIGFGGAKSLDKDCGETLPNSSLSEENHCQLWTLIWMNGRTLGAIAGVWLVGSSAGVQGNIWGLVLVPGLVLTVSLLSSYAEAWNLPEPIAKLMAIYYFPLVPAVFATVGYNIGATMKVDSSQAVPSNWGLDIPLFSVEF